MGDTTFAYVRGSQWIAIAMALLPACLPSCLPPGDFLNGSLLAWAGRDATRIEITSRLLGAAAAAAALEARGC